MRAPGHGEVWTGEDSEGYCHNFAISEKGKVEEIFDMLDVGGAGCPDGECRVKGHREVRFGKGPIRDT